MLNSVLLSACLLANPPAYDPTDAYRSVEVEGWRVLVNEVLFADENAELRADTLRILGDQLHQIKRVVPKGPAAEMRMVPIWVELSHPKHPCMCYHPSRRWLRENQMNPEKVKGVELSNCRNFINWTVDQPYMLLHELAHAYHDRVLGWDHEGILACYEAAGEAKLYGRVLHVNGRDREAYAATNHKEYFAECSEAFFGTNDFYPFVRGELRRHDPRMYELLEQVWGKKGGGNW